MTEEQLIKKLNKLKGVVTLTKEEKEQGRVLFLQKVEEYHSQQVAVKEAKNITRVSWPDRLLAPVRVLAEGFVQSRQLVRGALKVYSSHIFASVLITVFVFGAFGVYSGLSARQALPDNKPLYTLKTALEKTQLTLSFSSVRRAEVRVDFLARRVEELDKLVAKTAKYPERNGHVLKLAIKNTQDEISAVIEDLASVSENQNAKEINEIKKLVEEKISFFQIALGEMHEDLPDNIKADLGEDVQALSSAILEINDAIDYVEVDQFTKGAFDVATSSAGDLDDIFVTGDDMASTTITTTVDLLIDDDIEAEIVVPITIEEPFTIEKDTFEVRIGD